MKQYVSGFYSMFRCASGNSECYRVYVHPCDWVSECATVQAREKYMIRARGSVGKDCAINLGSLKEHLGKPILYMAPEEEINIYKLTLAKIEKLESDTSESLCSLSCMVTLEYARLIKDVYDDRKVIRPFEIYMLYAFDDEVISEKVGSKLLDTSDEDRRYILDTYKSELSKYISELELLVC